jgi:hypothetical protein
MENRSESRVRGNLRFFVHVVECATDPGIMGATLSCTGIDFSPHGMQLRTDKALPIDTVLSITLAIGEPSTMYLLAGSVRWTRTNPTGAVMGILLHDQEGTDYDQWVDSLYELMPSE